MSRRSTELVELERKMLDAVERAYEAWDESGGPVPMSLVKLMGDTHRAILSRLQKKYGDEQLEDPRAALIELERERDALKKLIEREHYGGLQ